jgi:hypothetical protein
MYTNYIESKTQTIKYFQYGGATLLFLIIIYSLIQLRIIESHAQEFFDYSKMIMQFPLDNKPLEPIVIEAESEIVEATDTINCFIHKINSAMDYSSEAIAKAKTASEKLEDITDEFDKIIHDIQDSSSFISQLDKSEDIMIQSNDELIKSTKKLEKLKLELDKVLNTCS